MSCFCFSIFINYLFLLSFFSARVPPLKYRLRILYRMTAAFSAIGVLGADGGGGEIYCWWVVVKGNGDVHGGK